MSAFDVLKDLPQTIPGEGIVLTRDHAAFWPFIERLPPRERGYLKQTGCSASVFASRDHYIDDIVPIFSTLGHGLALVNCWIVDSQLERIVGAIHIGGGAMNSDTIFHLGGYVLPAFRNRGYVSRGYKAAAAHMLSVGPTTHICAETRLSNTASKRSLLKAGFTDCGKGTSHARFHTGRVLRRFVITSQVPTWPYTSP